MASYTVAFKDEAVPKVLLSDSLNHRVKARVSFSWRDSTPSRHELKRHHA